MASSRSFKSNAASSRRGVSSGIGLPTNLQEKVKVARCNVDTSTIHHAARRHAPVDGGFNAAEAAAIESQKAHSRQQRKQGRLAAFQHEIHQRVSVDPSSSPRSSNGSSQILSASNRSTALSARNTNTVDAAPKSIRRKVPAVWQIKKRGRSQVPATHRVLKREIEAVCEDGFIQPEQLRKELLTNQGIKKALTDAIGVAGLTQEAFDAKFVHEANSKLSLECVMEELLSVPSASSRPGPGAGVCSHNPDVLDWARDRLSRCLSGGSPGRLAQGHLDGDTPSPALRPALGRVIDERKSIVIEDPQDAQATLDALIEEEMDQQRSFLFAMAREREQGRAELEAARAGERKHQEILRSVGANHRVLMKKVGERKIELPPLCACGVDALQPHSHACANNCIFYHNHTLYEQLLNTALSSLSI